MITVFCGAMTVYCDAITAQQAVAAFKTREIQVDAGGGDRVAPSRGMDALGALGGRDLTRPPAAGPPGAGARPQSPAARGSWPGVAAPGGALSCSGVLEPEADGLPPMVRTLGCPPPPASEGTYRIRR